MTDIDRLLDRFDAFMQRLEPLLPPARLAVDWSKTHAARWRHDARRGYLEAVTHPHKLRLSDIRCIDDQKRELDRNTRQFLAGAPANNALLWGARGTGKSSLVKALLHAYVKKGLRLIEVERSDLAAVPDIVACLAEQPWRFLIYFDDLAFEAARPQQRRVEDIGAVRGRQDDDDLLPAHGEVQRSDDPQEHPDIQPHQKPRHRSTSRAIAFFFNPSPPRNLPDRAKHGVRGNQY